MLTPALTGAESKLRAAAAARPAFELKGVMSSLTVLRLRTTDLSLIEQQLRAKIAPLPQFFLDAPVVIDPSGLTGGGDGLAWAGLAAVLRMLHLVPVGVTNVAEEHRAAISVARLPLLQLGAGRLRDLEARAPNAGTANGAATDAGDALDLNDGKGGGPAHPADATPGPRSVSHAEARAAGQGAAAVAQNQATKNVPHRPPMVVRQPVRSGQVIYARRGDLVVLAPVNPGAEVIADGNVHIYSTLRGRAIAGAQGYAGARIFCQRMEAEILSIAGAYLLADDIPEERRGRAVQVFLDEAGECRMAAL